MGMRLLAAVVVCLVGVGVSYAAEPTDTEAGVKAAADKYLEAFAARDLDGCLAAFAKGKNTVLMGTGPDERWVGLKAIGEAHEEMFKVFEKESFKRQWSSVSSRGKVAWTASETEITNIVDGKERKFVIHSSAVWTFRKEKWQIALMHCSNLWAPEKEGGSP